MSALHDDDAAWDRGPFAIFTLGGPVLAVGCSTEETRHRAERVLGEEIGGELRRWGADRIEAGALYIAPVDGALYEAVRTGRRFVIPADATPDEPSLAAAPKSPPAPGMGRAGLARRFRSALNPVFATADRFDALRADLLAALTEVTGEAIALTAGADANAIARATVEVGRAAALAGLRGAGADGKGRPA